MSDSHLKETVSAWLLRFLLSSSASASRKTKTGHPKRAYCCLKNSCMEKLGYLVRYTLVTGPPWIHSSPGILE